MALASIHVYRTLPGKLVEHQAATAEARERLQALGLAAFTLQPIAGTDVGTLATVVQYEDNRAYADAIQRVQADEDWMTFYAGVASQAIAEEVEVSLFQDTDPTYTPPADRPLGVLTSTQWRAKPGKMMSFFEHVEGARGHIERLGGTVRVLQSLIGKYPLTAAVSITFEDFDHFGDYNDKVAVDEQFQNYWAGVMADPSADLVRSGIYAIQV